VGEVTAVVLSLFPPLEDCDADLRDGEARRRRAQRRVSLLGVVGRRRLRDGIARGRAQRRQRRFGVVFVAAVFDSREFAVEGVVVPDGEGRAEGGEALVKVVSVDLFFFWMSEREREEVEKRESQAAMSL